MSRHRIWRYVSIEIRHMGIEFGVVEFGNTGQNLLWEREIFGPQFSDQKLDKLNFGGEHTP